MWEKVWKQKKMSRWKNNQKKHFWLMARLESCFERNWKLWRLLWCELPSSSIFPSIKNISNLEINWSIKITWISTSFCCQKFNRMVWWKRSMDKSFWMFDLNIFGFQCLYRKQWHCFAYCMSIWIKRSCWNYIEQCSEKIHQCSSSQWI